MSYCLAWFLTVIGILTVLGHITLWMNGIMEFFATCYYYFTHKSGEEVLSWARLCVCLSVCPRAYLRSHTRDLYQIFLCMLPMPVAQSSSGRVMKSQGEGAVLGVFLPIGKHRKAFAAKAIIPYRPGRGYGSAQRGRSVIYDCLVSYATYNRHVVLSPCIRSRDDTAREHPPPRTTGLHLSI